MLKKIDMIIMYVLGSCREGEGVAKSATAPSVPMLGNAYVLRSSLVPDAAWGAIVADPSLTEQVPIEYRQKVFDAGAKVCPRPPWVWVLACRRCRTPR